MSNIEWTDVSWNPVRGCSRVSSGCEHCYAETMAARIVAMSRGRGVAEGEGPYDGLVKRVGKEARWTGKVVLDLDKLAEPLRWRKPRRVFVNSMSDLFHESLTHEQIAAVFGVMAACPQHTFQVLTKRAERMPEWFEWVAILGEPAAEACRRLAMDLLGPTEQDGSWNRHQAMMCGYDQRWPLPNVHLGVSAENQETADERIPLLLRCPAAVRWVSVEPLLSPVDLVSHLHPRWTQRDYERTGLLWPGGSGSPRALDWVVVGGESGSGARLCDVDWIRSVRDQCRDARVPIFIKQLGSMPCNGGPFNVLDPPLRHPRGGLLSEWPEDLRVRELPA